VPRNGGGSDDGRARESVGLTSLLPLALDCEQHPQSNVAFGSPADSIESRDFANPPRDGGAVSRAMLTLSFLRPVDTGFPNGVLVTTPAKSSVIGCEINGELRPPNGGVSRTFWWDAVLIAAEGGVVSAEEPLKRAWDENADPFTNAVRITVSAWRKRLGEPAIITTVSGAGYRISTQRDTERERGDLG